MLPDLETFETAAKKYRGNLSKMAVAFGISRRMIHNWLNQHAEFKAVVHDERKRLFDDSLSVAEVVALGIPKKNENGVIVGWEERPDGNMLRFLLSTLGKDEGFGESIEITGSGTPIIGILLPDNKRGKVVEIENNENNDKNVEPCKEAAE